MGVSGFEEYQDAFVRLSAAQGRGPVETLCKQLLAGLITTEHLVRDFPSIYPEPPQQDMVRAQIYQAITEMLLHMYSVEQQGEHAHVFAAIRAARRRLP